MLNNHMKLMATIMKAADKEHFDQCWGLKDYALLAACLVARISQATCGLALATLERGPMFTPSWSYSSFKLQLNSQLWGGLLWVPIVLSSSTISTYCTVLKLSVSPHRAYTYTFFIQEKNKNKNSKKNKNNKNNFHWALIMFWAV